MENKNTLTHRERHKNTGRETDTQREKSTWRDTDTDTLRHAN